MKDKKDPAILKDSLSLALLFSSVVTRAFSWPIKGKVGMALRGIAPHQIKTTSIEPRTHSRAATELSTPVHSFHQRLGILSLSRPFVTPTANFQC